MTQLLLLIINALSLYFIGLLPYRILTSNNNLELAGILFVVLGLISWLPAIFVATALHLIVQKLGQLQPMPLKKILLVTVPIQLLGLAISALPLLGVRQSVNQAQSKLSLEPKIVYEAFDASTQSYSYEINVVNNTQNSLANIGTTITIGFAKDIGAKNYYNIFPNGSFDNGKITYHPGNTSLHGSIFIGNCKGSSFFKELPVKVGIEFTNIDGGNGVGFTKKNFYFTPNIANLDIEQYYREHCNWTPQI